MQPDNDVSLLTKNMLRLQSVAQFYVRVTSERELEDALAWARERKLPVTPLGEGSNIVCRNYIAGLVVGLDLTGTRLLSDDGSRVRLRVSAGENWHALVRWSSGQGFHGLENLALIPGSVGAAPVQNIGAYGVELASFIEAVHVYDSQTGERRQLSNSGCQFNYRHSLFKKPQGRHLIIVAVDLLLDRHAEMRTDYPSLAVELKNQSKTPDRVLSAVTDIRRRLLPDPRVTPNVGSFFKNPTVSWHDAEVISMRWPSLPQYPTTTSEVKLSAAWMIDELGWRGKSLDGVGVSADHALILINEAADSIEPVLALASQIVSSVEAEFGVGLEFEPDILG